MTFSIAIRTLLSNILCLLLACLKDEIIIYSGPCQHVGNPDTPMVGSALSAKAFSPYYFQEKRNTFT